MELYIQKLVLLWHFVALIFLRVYAMKKTSRDDSRMVCDTSVCDKQDE